jgi:hypothetical protein
MATSFSGGGSRSTRKQPPTMGKQLVNFITCGCESSAPFLVINKAGLEPTIIRFFPLYILVPFLLVLYFLLTYKGPGWLNDLGR